MNDFRYNTTSYILNSLVLLGLMVVLTVSLFWQFLFSELPCPLCLLQRMGMLSMAFGLLLNVRFGSRSSHYAIILLSGFFTSFVALRQISLHIMPGTGAYGSALLGFHLYTWAFIIAVSTMLVTTVIMGIDQGCNVLRHKANQFSLISRLLFGVFFILTAFVMAATFLECGFKACPDDPVEYIYLWH